MAGVMIPLVACSPFIGKNEELGRCSNLIPSRSFDVMSIVAKARLGMSLKTLANCSNSSSTLAATWLKESLKLTKTSLVGSLTTLSKFRPTS